eukprot:TRINITY_DN2581_c0_g1_i6.p1 TRINITY_DN2581_c0_g1~~TRINITY_DN2581_c0_g1_i6.p1  ORF type:complete len:205 (+),score=-22.27 TRINITY_DN2581_c0_g1_i6:177-791(+)
MQQKSIFPDSIVYSSHHKSYVYITSITHPYHPKYQHNTKYGLFIRYYTDTTLQSVKNTIESAQLEIKDNQNFFYFNYTASKKGKMITSTLNIHRSCLFANLQSSMPLLEFTRKPNQRQYVFQLQIDVMRKLRKITFSNTKTQKIFSISSNSCAKNVQKLLHTRTRKCKPTFIKQQQYNIKTLAKIKTLKCQKVRTHNKLYRVGI